MPIYFQIMKFFNMVKHYSSEEKKKRYTHSGIDKGGGLKLTQNAVV